LGVGAGRRGGAWGRREGGGCSGQRKQGGGEAAMSSKQQAAASSRLDPKKQKKRIEESSRPIMTTKLTEIWYYKLQKQPLSLTPSLKGQEGLRDITENLFYFHLTLHSKKDCEPPPFKTFHRQNDDM